jgi:hypothetical protein
MEFATRHGARRTVRATNFQNSLEILSLHMEAGRVTNFFFIEPCVSSRAHLCRQTSTALNISLKVLFKAAPFLILRELHDRGFITQRYMFYPDDVAVFEKFKWVSDYNKHHCVVGRPNSV